MRKEHANTLEVSPSSAIQSRSSGNEDVHLTVTTDASFRGFTTPEWAVAEKEGDDLSVGVKDKAGTDQLIGSIIVS